MKPRVVAIIQARVGSNRLPMKVVRLINGETVLARVVNRVKLATSIDGIVIATTTNEGDDIIVDLCQENKVSYYRGSEEDVLDRFYRTALAFHADVIVRITGDCPLIDPSIIDKCVRKFLNLYHEIDYVSNLLPRTYPRGLDVEVVDIRTLEEEWKTSELWREHVTLNIRKNLENYRVHNIASELDYSYMRWTIDTAEDLEFARRIYKFFGDESFEWEDVMGLLGKHPEWVIKDTQVDPT